MKSIALTDRQIALLKNFQVEENRAIYASKERIDDWAAIKVVFTTLGGKWRTGRPGYFLFDDDVDIEGLIDQVLATKTVQKPDTFDFFPTPAELVARIIDLAEIEPDMLVLEPSAGTGNIAIQLRDRGARVECIEMNEKHCRQLRSLGLTYWCSDFTKTLASRRFDRVVMNPPFSKKQDVQHVQHAIGHLKPSERLVAIMSQGTRFRQDSTIRSFHAYVERTAAAYSWLDVPAGAFAESGTNVATTILVYDAKP